jgi:hypothetical protein
MYPFHDASLSEVLREHLSKLIKEIASLDTGYVLKASPAELEEHFYQKGFLEPLVLQAGQVHVESHTGVDVDVSRDFSRAVFPGERAFVRGTRLTIAIPYEGDKQLWRFQPSSFSFSGYPDIEVLEDQVRFYVTFPDDAADTDRIRGQIQSDVGRLSEAAGTVKRDVEAFNASLGAQVRAAVEARRGTAFKSANVLAGLGIPITRAAGPPAYSFPAKRKKPPSLPRVETQSYQPEPVLSDAEYDHILGILRSMSLVIERNPQSFAGLGEDDIRTHFLLHLNGHYEGTATGETFNASGKTDILIRHGDRNVFIAECKVWRGSKQFDAAITQLLSYLSWRDSKCALLIFNRNRDSSTVSERMDQVMAQRSEWRKSLGPDSRGDQRYVFVKESDPGREIAITTMLFDMSGVVSLPTSAA